MKLWKDNYRRGQYRKKKPHFESVKIPKTPPQLRKASSPATRPSLVLQDARLSVRRNIWDESGRGLPISDTLVFRARSLTVSHATKPHTFRRAEKRWCWSADHRGPSLRLKGASINIQFLNVRFFWKVQSLCSFISTSVALYMPQYEWFLTSSTSPSAIERINRSIFEDRIQDAAIS